GRQQGRPVGNRPDQGGRPERSAPRARPCDPGARRRRREPGVLARPGLGPLAHAPPGRRPRRGASPADRPDRAAAARLARRAPGRRTVRRSGVPPARRRDPAGPALRSADARVRLAAVAAAPHTPGVGAPVALIVLLALVEAV